MGYVSKNLLKGEEVLHAGHIHWSIYVAGALFAFIGILMFISGAELVTSPIVLLIGLILLAKAFIDKFSTEMVVTNKRVITKTGLISRNTVELNHAKVESFNVAQGILGRILGYGTIVVQGTGGGKAKIKYIEDPLAFKRKAMEIIDTTQALRI